ncbi:TIGR00299 family protein [Mangrovactinospora gilvigrisea]|uniref:Pyridinium-3,5-bisthiocarboxylic acid mononucleotide nickel insertion protein n=1 Tax=Mangrovactinospora gilvigrisea TaxID=1428644 RepID=A0A1J7C1T8_9ACTN|nr:nickel pincer cofactor biosynthesis protein LarC [Mangrovactinospora gilvigrisea]OIV35536.1 TIGR00299 family protein [Mangrovactinospora gilvigrisea]
MNLIWLNPFSGISGDMLLGALLDLGAPLDDIRAAVASTGLTGWELTAERVVNGGIAATHARTATTDTATHRSAAALLEMVSRAEPAPVAAAARRAVTAIAEAEGTLHDQDPATVHLHEIGGWDTVIDTVGAAAALHALGGPRLSSAPPALGTGSVRTRHGVMPSPAPATMALLAAAGAPAVGADVPFETVTPTGAALLGVHAERFGPMPAMTLRRIGYGAGTKEFPGRANVLPAVLGDAPSGSDAAHLPQELLETNVDDVTGEVLGHLLGVLLAAGAADAWITPVVMKKNRPAHTVHVLADPGAPADRLAELLLRETGSLGLRRSPLTKLALPRRTAEVDVRGHRIRVKAGPHGAKPEHDDVAAAAAALGAPLRAVADEARAAFHGSTTFDAPSD